MALVGVPSRQFTGRAATGTFCNGLWSLFDATSTPEPLGHGLIGSGGQVSAKGLGRGRPQSVFAQLTKLITFDTSSKIRRLAFYHDYLS